MSTIVIINIYEKTTDKFEGKNIDCCLQALKNLRYEITQGYDCYEAWKDGLCRFQIRSEKNVG